MTQTRMFMPIAVVLRPSGPSPERHEYSSARPFGSGGSFWSRGRPHLPEVTAAPLDPRPISVSGLWPKHVSHAC